MRGLIIYQALLQCLQGTEDVPLYYKYNILFSPN